MFCNRQLVCAKRSITATRHFHFQRSTEGVRLMAAAAAMTSLVHSFVLSFRPVAKWHCGDIGGMVEGRRRHCLRSTTSALQRRCDSSVSVAGGCGRARTGGGGDDLDWIHPGDNYSSLSHSVHSSAEGRTKCGAEIGQREENLVLLNESYATVAG